MQDSFTSIFDILRLLAAGLRQVKGKSHTLMMGIKHKPQPYPETCDGQE